MLTCQSHQFQLPSTITYLNCAAQSPLPLNVEAAGIKGVQRKSLPHTIGQSDYFDPVVELKKRFAQLLHLTDFQRVAIIPAVSYGMANVVQNIKIVPGKSEIILLEDQFPSNYYPWKVWADQHQITLKIIKAPKAAPDRAKVWNERILAAITPATLAVSLPQIHWTDGTLFDLEKIRTKTKALAALLIIDGSQSVGAMPMHLDQLQPDAVICAGYKWLMGPYGFGLAYYGPYFDNGQPIEQSWINRKDSDNFARLVNYQGEFKEKANRYSMGEHSNFIAIPMLLQAIENLLAWEVEQIQRYCENLIAKPVEELQTMGCLIEDPAYRSAHLFGIRLPKQVAMEAVMTQFQQQQIFVSRRGNTIRVSQHLYNQAEDFEQLIGAIKMAWKGKFI